MTPYNIDGLFTGPVTDDRIKAFNARINNKFEEKLRHQSKYEI
jgi:hypothetical protein